MSRTPAIETITISEIVTLVKTAVVVTLSLCLPVNPNRHDTVHLILNTNELIDGFLLSQLREQIQTMLGDQPVMLRARALYSPQSFAQSFKASVPFEVVHHTKVCELFDRQGIVIKAAPVDTSSVRGGSSKP